MAIDGADADGVDGVGGVDRDMVVNEQQWRKADACFASQSRRSRDGKHGASWLLAILPYENHYLYFKTLSWKSILSTGKSNSIEKNITITGQEDATEGMTNVGDLA